MTNQKTYWKEGLTVFMDPDDTVDYQMDWSRRLSTGGSITDFSVLDEPGITATAIFFDATTTTMRLSSATAGTYTCTFRATFSTGERIDLSINVEVAER